MEETRGGRQGTCSKRERGIGYIYKVPVSLGRLTRVSEVGPDDVTWGGRLTSRQHTHTRRLPGHLNTFRTEELRVSVFRNTHMPCNTMPTRITALSPSWCAYPSQCGGLEWRLHGEECGVCLLALPLAVVAALPHRLPPCLLRPATHMHKTIKDQHQICPVAYKCAKCPRFTPFYTSHSCMSPLSDALLLWTGRSGG